ncbi:MAG: nucleotide exchange factor GrpE [Anaerococcus sp.]|nr:nucleotide exchange factor GrpE [Peptoniphilaceae bacterium]MDY3055509.1 nucleotide exchange factor GrpE [Anaerococcus sp.]
MAEEKKNKDEMNTDSEADKLEEEIEEEIEEIEAEAVDENGDPCEKSSPDQSNEYLDKYQRLLADFNNYKRREEKAKAEFKSYAAGSLIEKLLPVLDNFDRALKDCDEEDPFVQGIVMTRNELWKVLENEGLSEIPSDNEEFDPNFHQAFMTEESDEVEENHIIETFQKGYKLKDKVIRPSMVKVSK